MASSTNDYFKKSGASTVTTLAAPGKALAATSITVGSTTNYPTDTGIIIGIRQVDSNGTLVPGTYTEWSATVSSATTFAIVATPVLGSDQVYPAGSTTQVFLPVSSSAHNKLVDGILEFADQSGNLLNQAVKDALGVTTDPAGGWDLLNAGTGPNTTTANGNHSYDLVFNSVDLTSVLSKGMRLKLTRTVTAPTQCADLEASSSQYFNKTSPTGMTFTDDFVVSAWIKLESYADMSISSRYNGTSGFRFFIAPTGRVYLQGTNGGVSNYRRVSSYQSLPLGKWVHVTAQLDMSTYTATTTTCYVMFDGVDVPAALESSGTNPTALVQAGNLEIGAENSGTIPFDGKIAQVAIYSAKVTQATIRASMNQTLTGSETSLVSAFTLNNSLLDLTANDNDLTAQGSALATNTDSPFAGGNVQEYTDGTTEMAVVMADPVFSTNTTVTVQVPEGYALPTSGGISAVYYSTQKVPYGFPVSRGKWRIEYNQIGRTYVVAASITSWYNANDKITVPVGEWEIGYSGSVTVTASAAAYIAAEYTMSTANNTEGDKRLRRLSPETSATSDASAGSVSASAPVSLSAQTDYFFNGRPIVATSTIYFGSVAAGGGMFYGYADNAYI